MVTTTVTTQVISAVGINLICVLDRFFQMIKKFTIYSQVVLKTENIEDLTFVKNVIDTYDNALMVKND